MYDDCSNTPGRMLGNRNSGAVKLREVLGDFRRQLCLYRWIKEEIDNLRMPRVFSSLVEAFHPHDHCIIMVG
jgi:hypothetical protein